MPFVEEDHGEDFQPRLGNLTRNGQCPVKVGELLLQRVEILRGSVDRSAAGPGNVEFAVAAFILRELRLNRLLHALQYIRQFVDLGHLSILSRTVKCGFRQIVNMRSAATPAKTILTLSLTLQKKSMRASSPPYPRGCVVSEPIARGKASDNLSASACGESPSLAANSHINEGPTT